MDLEKLYNTYYVQVYSYVLTLGAERELAEEITQEAFCRAVYNASRFRNESGELTWVCSIAKNLFFDEKRKQKRERNVTAVATDRAEDCTAEKLEDAELAHGIHLALTELSEPYGAVFRFRVFGELSFAEIAAIYGRSESWARVTYHRARLKIRERIGVEDE